MHGFVCTVADDGLQVVIGGRRGFDVEVALFHLNPVKGLNIAVTVSDECTSPFSI